MHRLMSCKMNTLTLTLIVCMLINALATTEGFSPSSFCPCSATVASLASRSTESNNARKFSSPICCDRLLLRGGSIGISSRNRQSTRGGDERHRKNSRWLMSSSSPSSSSSTTSSTSTLNQSSDKPAVKASSSSSSSSSLSPEDSASFMSKVFFAYATPLIDLSSKKRQGTNNADDAIVKDDDHDSNTTPLTHSHVPQGDTLTISDAYEFPSQKQMAYGPFTQQFQKLYNDASSSSSSSSSSPTTSRFPLSPLTVAILRSHKGLLLKSGVFRLLNTLVQIFPPILLSHILQSITKIQLNGANGLPPSPELLYNYYRTTALCSTLFFTALSIKTVFENHYFHNLYKSVLLARGGVGTLLFDKILYHTVASNSSPSSSTATSSPLTLFLTEIHLVEHAFSQIHSLWDSPLQILIYTSLLYRILGKSSFAAIAIMGLLTPINLKLIYSSQSLLKNELVQTENRCNKVRETLSSFKSVLLCGWSMNVKTTINDIRTKEETARRKYGIIKAWSNALLSAMPSLVIVGTLAAYTYNQGGVGTLNKNNNKGLNAAIAFSALSLLNQMRFPIVYYPQVVNAIAEGKAAIGRIENYLGEGFSTVDESRIDGFKSSYSSNSYIERIVERQIDSLDQQPTVKISNGEFYWPGSGGESKLQSPSVSLNSHQRRPALTNIDVSIYPGEIVAIIGAVGSGKTALLKAILGEMTISSNSNNCNDKNSAVISITGADPYPGYFSQEPWLSRGTVKDSILFGREYDRELYDEVIMISGLGENFNSPATQTSPISSDTLVTEGGLSLSGGQRARVALARALYSKGSVLLLDDPFAPLDTKVKTEVFNSLKKFVKAERAATLLVTSDPSIMRGCDRIAIMGKGDEDQDINRIVDIGTYDELISRGHDLSITVHSDSINTISGSGSNVSAPASANSAAAAVVSCNDGGIFADDFVTEVPSDRSPEDKASYLDSNSMCTEEILIDPDSIPPSVNAYNADVTCSVAEISTPSIISPVTSTASATKKTSLIPLTLDDKMSKDAVPLSTYANYFKAVDSPILLSVILFSFMAANAAIIGQQFVVARWTEASEAGLMTPALQMKFQSLMITTSLLCFAFHYLRSHYTYVAGMRASKTLHNRMLNSVFSAPVTFFDSIPSGQLLSRFGRELQIVDKPLPEQLGWLVFCYLHIFSTFFAIAGAVSPVIFLPISILGVFYVRIMSKFRIAARDLKRSESKSRSPLTTQFSEALKGVEIIRSIKGARERWSHAQRSLMDDNLSAAYTLKILDRWLSMRLETIGNIIVFLVAALSSRLAGAKTLTAGAAGWGITQALTVTALMNWAVRSFIESETMMYSVQRITELSEANIVPRELSEAGEAFADAEQRIKCPTTDKALLESGWPWKGKVEFRNVSLRYNKFSPRVVDNINISIEPGSTVGIVGKTGSGKSSLLLALFRILELDVDPEQDEMMPSILIDGVDIRSVQLQSLRDRLSIIPQEAFLMAGTLRYNLNPEADLTNDASNDDERYWKVLYTVSPALATKFKMYGSGLDTHILEQGKGMSAGERQLICLSRALLKKSKIVVLDESSSSMDMLTDKYVNDVIRREFTQKGVTVIAVAHRLQHLLEYDKVVVLDGGRVIEDAPPKANKAFKNMLKNGSKLSE